LSFICILICRKNHIPSTSFHLHYYTYVEKIIIPSTLFHLHYYTYICRKKYLRACLFNCITIGTYVEKYNDSEQVFSRRKLTLQECAAHLKRRAEELENLRVLE
jgi:hypothetical protein